jgi:hypothetical protein
MEKPIFMYADSFGDFVWWVSYWLLCEPAGQWTLGIVTVALLGLVVKRKTRLIALVLLAGLTVLTFWWIVPFLYYSYRCVHSQTCGMRG